MEFMLTGVAGCTGVDTLSILQKMRQKVENLTVDIDGERAEDYPMVFTDAIFVGLILTGTVSGIFAVILGILATVFVVTSLVSFCPLYYPFKLSTRKEG